ncbi:MAG: hypothetical protein JRG93_14325 [Deltaproteobacteria bacterium]|nr:hypothetical protein [Deltaproteobacteria bacterium]
MVGIEGGHALHRPIAFHVTAYHSEGLAIDIRIAGTRDATAEPLIVSEDATRKPVRAIGARFAGDPTVHARIALAGKARNAVVGIVATGIDAQAASNTQVALVSRIAAVVVVLAGAATGDETT